MIFTINPMGAVRKTRADAWKGRKCVKREYAYRDELRRQAKEANFELGCEVDIEFVIPMPESWSKKKKAEMDGKPHQQKPDIDNLLKGFFDTLRDNNDQDIWSVTAVKSWGYIGKIYIAKEDF